MTVEEYLKIVNNVPASDALTARHLSRFGGGFLNVVPDNHDFENAGGIGVPQIFVGEDSVFVRREITFVEDGQLVDKMIERETALSDDIALHCRKGKTPVQVLEDTITGLTEIYESEQRIGSTPSPIQSRIEALKVALEHYKSLEAQTGEESKTPKM